MHSTKKHWPMTNHQSGMGGACYKVNSSVALHAEMLQIMRCIEQHAVRSQTLKNKGMALKKCPSFYSPDLFQTDAQRIMLCLIATASVCPESQACSAANKARTAVCINLRNNPQTDSEQVLTGLVPAWPSDYRNFPCFFFKCPFQSVDLSRDTPGD